MFFLQPWSHSSMPLLLSLFWAIKFLCPYGYHWPLLFLVTLLTLIFSLLFSSQLKEQKPDFIIKSDMLDILLLLLVILSRTKHTQTYIWYMYIYRCICIQILKLDNATSLLKRPMRGSFYISSIDYWCNLLLLLQVYQWHHWLNFLSTGLVLSVQWFRT